MLYNFIFSLGIHIGSIKFSLRNYYKPFIIGYRNNYCIFNVDKVIFFLKRALFFFYHLGNTNNLFLFYIHTNTELSFPLTLYFIKMVSGLRNMLFTERWSYGQLSNMYTSCYILFTDIFIFKEANKNNKAYLSYNKINFYNFFFSLLHYTFYKRIPGMEWETHIKRIEKYWRFFLYFKFYRYLNRFPDVFLFFSSYNFPIPAIESRNLKIPCIGNLDINFSYHMYISYPLLGNSQSVFTFLFYFIMLMSFYRKGKLVSYSSLL